MAKCILVIDLPKSCSKCHNKDIANKLFKQKSGFLHGGAGIGKTTLICSLAKKFIEKGKNVHFELARNVTASFQDFKKIEDRDAKDSFVYKLSDLQNVDILFIDDFYREKLTDWSLLNVWSPILQTRIDNKKQTYVTSNYSVSELGVKIEKISDFTSADAIIGRLSEIGIVELKGENYRSNTNVVSK